MAMFNQNEHTKTLSKNKTNKKQTKENEEALSNKDSAFSNALFNATDNSQTEENTHKNTEKSQEDNKYLFDTENKKRSKNPLKKVTFKKTKVKKENKFAFGKHKIKKTFLDDTTIKKPVNYGGEIYYELRDGTYMKFVQVYPKDIMSRNNNEQILDMGVVMNMLKQYDKDNKLISLNMPIDTEKQRSHLIKKLDKTKNDVHRHFLEEKIEKLVFLEQSSRMERSFLAMMFGESLQQIEYHVDLFTRSMINGFPIKKLSFEEEKKILYKFHNLNEEIK
ncbi:hypothetical protein [Staphylococcus haemolyticus]|uniref:hypothetical protein n=1 Tax=Staphylococcus haemolyticus TaxID=1283 RepID=UPI001F0ADC28|nr:hypothetical protein [Staphylococcus haemolyticus]MCH4446445.1 hypothetical protein [Staphylococcus haemolyticus]